MSFQDDKSKPSMRIISYYIGKSILSATAMVIVVLIALFAFILFIEELNQIGQGRYGIMQAIQYVLLDTPGLLYEFFPVAALLGSLVALGNLVNSNEMTVIQAAGVSLEKIIWAVLKAAFLIMCCAILIGEVLVPRSQEMAQDIKSFAIADQVALKTRNGFWARDGQSYINIRKLLPGERAERVYIYEFDDKSRLRVSTFAKRARYGKGKWSLEDIEQTVFEADAINVRKIARADWDSFLNPKIINMVVVKPTSLSIYDLYQYIQYAKSNGQNSLLYEQTLWRKLIYPFAAVVLVFLSIPIVLHTRHRIAIGPRVILGAFIGLAFHILNNLTNNLGLVFNLSPIVSIALPTFLTLLVGLFLMRKVSRRTPGI
jgi:lipopolysaccharide export system permease protein